MNEEVEQWIEELLGLDDSYTMDAFDELERIEGEMRAMRVQLLIKEGNQNDEDQN